MERQVSCCKHWDANLSMETHALQSFSSMVVPMTFL